METPNALHLLPGVEGARIRGEQHQGWHQAPSTRLRDEAPRCPTRVPVGRWEQEASMPCLFSVPIETKLKWRWQKKIKASVKESTRSWRARVGHGERLMDKEGRKKRNLK